MHLLARGTALATIALVCACRPPQRVRAPIAVRLPDPPAPASEAPAHYGPPPVPRAMGITDTAAGAVQIEEAELDEARSRALDVAPVRGTFDVEGTAGVFGSGQVFGIAELGLAYHAEIPLVVRVRSSPGWVREDAARGAVWGTIGYETDYAAIEIGGGAATLVVPPPGDPAATGAGLIVLRTRVGAIEALSLELEAFFLPLAGDLGWGLAGEGRAPFSPELRGVLRVEGLPLTGISDFRVGFSWRAVGTGGAGSLWLELLGGAGLTEWPARMCTTCSGNNWAGGIGALTVRARL